MLTYGDTVHHNPVSLRSEMDEYTMFCDGMSKAFASTGLRVGWSFGAQYVMDKMKSIAHTSEPGPEARAGGVGGFAAEI